MEDILDDSLVEMRRRSLIPVWMKIFVWIFMILGILVLPMFILGLLGFKYQLALYGFSTTEPTSSTGLLLLALFIYKGCVAFALWLEKDWAITLAIIDSIIGFAVCFVSMIPFTTFRVEVVILLLYLLKLVRIKDKWKIANCN